MEIGEKIFFIEKGVKAWEGSKDEILLLKMKVSKICVCLQFI
jgi:hypothetical protein